MTVYTQTVNVGSSFEQTFVYTLNDSPVNLTGWGAVFRLRDESDRVISTVRYGDTGDRSLTIDGSRGTIDVTMVASATSGFTAKTGTFELEIYELINTGRVFRIVDGAVRYRPRGRAMLDNTVCVIRSTTNQVVVETQNISQYQRIDRGPPGAAGASALNESVPVISDDPAVGTSGRALRLDAQYGVATRSRHGFMRYQDKLAHDARMSHSTPLLASGDTSGNTDGAAITDLFTAGVRHVVLGRGHWYVKPDTLDVHLTQGATLRGETSGYGAGHGTILHVVGTTGSRVIDARSTLGFRLRDIGICIDDMRYIGDVLDLDGGTLANDSVKPIIDNVNFYTTATSATPLAVVCSAESQPVVGVSGTASYACRPTIVIDAGGTTFSYSESGGGGIGEVPSTVAASTDPYGTGDGQYVVTGVAIPAGDTWSVPAGKRSTGLTFSFASGTYTAGVKYRCGLGPRRLINASSCYDGEITNCQFQFGYDGVFNSGIGLEIKRIEGNPQFTRYLCEAYVGNKLKIEGTVSKRGVFLTQCYDSVVNMSSADLYDAGPWHTLDGCTFTRFEGGVMQGSGVGIAVRNGCKWTYVHAHCGLQTTPVNFVSGGGSNIYTFFSGTAQGASWYSGTNCSVVEWAYLASGTTFSRYLSRPIIEGNARLFNLLDCHGPDAYAKGGIRGASLLGVQAEAVTPDVVNWSTSPSKVYVLSSNVTFTLTPPSDQAARGLELTIVAHATTRYTVSYIGGSGSTIQWVRGAPPDPEPNTRLYIWGSWSGSATNEFRLDWYRKEKKVSLGSLSGTVANLDLSRGPHIALTLGGNVTVTALGIPSAPGRGRLEVTQDATGGRTLTFPAAYWPSGTPAGGVQPSSGANDMTVYEWTTDGTNVFLTSLGKMVSV